MFCDTQMLVDVAGQHSDCHNLRCRLANLQQSCIVCQNSAGHCCFIAANQMFWQRLLQPGSCWILFFPQPSRDMSFARAVSITEDKVTATAALAFDMVGQRQGLSCNLNQQICTTLLLLLVQPTPLR